VAWPDTPGVTDGSIDGAMQGNDGLVDRSVDSQACIELADIPAAWVRTSDSSTRISSRWVVDGPCDASVSSMTVMFYYWQKGYSCPSVGDRVTCEVEATSSSGATTVFSVEFVALPLSALMLHWEPQPYTITVTFPSLDGGTTGAGGGGAGGGGAGGGGAGGGGAGGGAGGTWSEMWTTVAIADGRMAVLGNPAQPPNGYGWVSLAPATTLLSPLCSGVRITSSAPCLTVPDWSDQHALCISGSIPAFNEAIDDFSLNWGIMVGANVTEPSGGGLGAAYTRTFVTLSGAPATGLRLVVHRKGDPDSITYCVAVTALARIPFDSFNTRCWDGTGIYLRPEDVPNIDKIALYVPSTASPVSIENLCLTGLYLQ
jgi:hypothetical protein